MFWEPPLQNWIGYESFLGFHLWGKLELTQYAPEPKIVPEKPTMIRFHWNVQDGIAFSHNKPPAKCSAIPHPSPKCHLLTIWKNTLNERAVQFALFIFVSVSISDVSHPQFLFPLIS